MKKLFSTLTLTVCLGAFISCTNDEQEVNMVKPTNANSEIEVINDGTMIKFKDVESYENALLKVSAMSTSEQVSFLNSLSFKSQMILMQEADGELDKICNQAADKAEFDVLYEKYKHKYGDVFMFNTIDATDLSPYSRLVYVANEYFVIDLFDVVYSFAEAVFNMSNLFRPGVVKEDRFFVAQPDMIVMIDPAESNGSR